MLTRDNHVLQSRLRRSTGSPRVVTQYAPLLAVLSLIERVAPSGSPVLISGESGTGKDLIARLLHEQGGRAAGPFIDLNCAALAESLVEVELFGVEKGAFPGADARKLGLIEMAAGGTLYLDNIGDLDVKVQGKLVRALETGDFYRVGGTQKVQVNVHVIASTTRDLSRMAATGAFRDDLLHRINTIRVALPPLRERVTDVPLLAEYFLAQFGGGVPPMLTPDALSALERYRWPGNVRELRNVIERAVLLTTDGMIRASDLPLGTDVGAAGRATPTAMMTLEALERRHIADVLDRTQWHQGRAAELLGISPKTLYRKIREFGFRRPSGRS
jgi:DNA-binding NtrC family response regulator